MQMLTEKWARVLDHEDAPKIADRHRRMTTAQLLENQMIAMKEEARSGQFMTMLAEDHHAAVWR